MLFLLIFMIDSTVNLINRIYYDCERKNHITIFREHLIITPIRDHASMLWACTLHAGITGSAIQTSGSMINLLLLNMQVCFLKNNILYYFSHIFFYYRKIIVDPNHTHAYIIYDLNLSSMTHISKCDFFFFMN